MNGELFQQAEQAFHQILEARANVDLKHVSMLSLCGGDLQLLAEVRALLEHHDAAEASSSTGSTVGDGVKSTRGFLSPADLHGWRYAAAAPESLLAEWDASAVGQRVGEFTLIGELGSGGMGVVFIAQQDRPRRAVALKLIRRQVATPAMIRRFEREADLLGRLNHSGIAQIYSAGVAELIGDDESGPVRVPYIAMELVEGTSIHAFVEGLSEGREGSVAHRAQLTMPLIVQLCDAVQHAHERGVIHRDLKPANILVTESGGERRIKVLDFGIARAIDGDEGRSSGVESHARASESMPAPKDGMTRLTADGHFVGTLPYMSPEQLRTDGEVDALADVYAIGAIFYFLLTGRPPIAAHDCTFAEATRRILTESPAPIAVRKKFFGLYD